MMTETRFITVQYMSPCVI